MFWAESNVATIRLFKSYLLKHVICHKIFESKRANSTGVDFISMDVGIASMVVSFPWISSNTEVRAVFSSILGLVVILKALSIIGIIKNADFNSMWAFSMKNRNFTASLCPRGLKNLWFTFKNVSKTCQNLVKYDQRHVKKELVKDCFLAGDDN